MYQKKYLKYKIKYAGIKKMIGGGHEDYNECIKYIKYFSKRNKINRTINVNESEYNITLDKSLADKSLADKLCIHNLSTMNEICISTVENVFTYEEWLEYIKIEPKLLEILRLLHTEVSRNKEPPLLPQTP